MKVGQERLVVIGVLALSLPAAPLVRAQYTADYQTNVISGVISNWTGDYLIGSNTCCDALIIQDGGVLFDMRGRMAYLAGSSNNSVLVTGPGSVWSNQSGVSVGSWGSGNSLVISNGGQVVGPGAGVGDGPGSSGNSAILTGTGTVWNTSLVLGSHGPNNRLVISDGAQFNGSCAFGTSLMSSNNRIVVVGTGSTLSNNADLTLISPGNSLVISNGGSVADNNGIFNGKADTVVVSDTGSVWSNSGNLTVYVSDNSLVISNGGKVVNSAANVGFDQQANSGGNTVIVSGLGSVWSNNSTLSFGVYSGTNNLIIDQGGKVVDRFGYVGNDSASRGNAVVITDTNSDWSSVMDLYIGRYGVGNQLTINNGARVANSYAYLGYDGASQSNRVVVSGPGSLWENGSALSVGYAGCHNSLVISNGGRVTAPSVTVGNNPSGCGHEVLVDGADSLWSDSGTLTFGDMASNCGMVITNGGRVASRSAFVGRSSACCYTRVLVAGIGSIWSNSASLYIGYAGYSNRLSILDGAAIISSGAYVGGNYSSSRYNSALISGTGSAWSNNGSLYVGVAGDGNSLMISSGGQVVDHDAWVGDNSSNNTAWVTDGATWRNDILSIGNRGSSNALVVDGGTVLATNLMIGAGSAACDNVVQLNNGSGVITNATLNATLEIRRGTFILNGGLLQVDRLVMTNACGLFVRNGGTLSVTSLVLDSSLDADGDGIPNGWEQAYGFDPLNSADATLDADGDGFTNLQEYQAGTDPTNGASAFRIVGIARAGDDIRVTWATSSGKTNALQASSDVAVSGFTNTFTDLFGVTNAVGGFTNFLDVGVSTNAPSRFYRVRLVP